MTTQALLAPLHRRPEHALGVVVRRLDSSDPQECPQCPVQAQEVGAQPKSGSVQTKNAELWSDAFFRRQVDRAMADLAAEDLVDLLTPLMEGRFSKNKELADAQRHR